MENKENARPKCSEMVSKLGDKVCFGKDTRRKLCENTQNVLKENNQIIMGRENSPKKGNIQEALNQKSIQNTCEDIGKTTTSITKSLNINDKVNRFNVISALNKIKELHSVYENAVGRAIGESSLKNSEKVCVNSLYINSVLDNNFKLENRLPNAYEDVRNGAECSLKNNEQFLVNHYDSKNVLDKNERLENKELNVSRDVKETGRLSVVNASNIKEEINVNSGLGKESKQFIQDVNADKSFEELNAINDCKKGLDQINLQAKLVKENCVNNKMNTVLCDNHKNVIKINECKNILSENNKRLQENISILNQMEEIRFEFNHVQKGENNDQISEVSNTNKLKDYVLNDVNDMFDSNQFTQTHVKRNKRDAKSFVNIDRDETSKTIPQINELIRTELVKGDKETKPKVGGVFENLKEINVQKQTVLTSSNKQSKVQSIPEEYTKAIETLNTLQSNLKALKETERNRNNPKYEKEANNTLFYLNKLNITLDDVKKMNIIHISGTKGKGSTSAYCESILRSYGYRTGFFSSPHLIEVRERIKLCGKPIEYGKFTKYFWHVYDNLYGQREHADDMPAYFKFLTVMAYYIFIKEKMDVSIIEVGIGGLYDSTNICPNTDIVGITSLGYDHISVLGKTIEEITLQKAGIMKPNCITVVSRHQRKETIPLLIDKSNALKCILLEAPHILHYKWNGYEIDDDWKNTFQSLNISLAIQLAYLWMYKMNRSNEIKQIVENYFKAMNISFENVQKIIQDKCIENGASKGQHVFPDRQIDASNHLKTQNEHPNLQSNQTNLLNSYLIVGPQFEITKEIYDGLKSCVWPGRIQTIRQNNFKYFLDGAHTVDSIQLCSKWFQEKSKHEESKLCNKEKNLKIIDDLEHNENASLESSNGIDINKDCTNLNINENLHNAQIKRKTFVNTEETIKSSRDSNEHEGRKNNIRVMPNVKSNPKIGRILVFNVTGDRNPAKLLPPLLECNFDYILITPNILSDRDNPDVQYGNKNVGSDSLSRISVDSSVTGNVSNKKNCDFIDKNSDASKNILKFNDKTESRINEKNNENVLNFNEKSTKSNQISVDVQTPVNDLRKSATMMCKTNVDSMNFTTSDSDKLASIRNIVDVANKLSKGRDCQVVMFSNVLDTYNFKHKLDCTKEYHVLVTGSLHLVGAFLNVLSTH